jgi:Family of unknown function (DUF6502)
MSPSKPARSTRRRKTLAGGHSSSIDSRALEAVGRFVRILARAGCTPEDIAREVGKACRQVPKSWAHKAMAALREMDDGSHVLTLWFSDPAYLDPKGNPRPLPLRGAGGSLESLAHRVDPKLEARKVLRYLSLGVTMRRIGRRYVPRDRVFSLRGAMGADTFHQVRNLLGMLRTLEHNGQLKRRAPGWFEFCAGNRHFPASARQAFDKRLRLLATRFLFQIDADMHRRERARQAGDRTVHLGVGVYRFESEGGPVNRVARRPRRRSR